LSPPDKGICETSRFLRGVPVEPAPEYHIGGRDNALNEAFKWIKAR
jgi:hypothetical protein